MVDNTLGYYNTTYFFALLECSKLIIHVAFQKLLNNKFKFTVPT